MKFMKMDEDMQFYDHYKMIKESIGLIIVTNLSLIFIMNPYIYNVKKFKKLFK